jgi:hypothetical protein
MMDVVVAWVSRSFHKVLQANWSLWKGFYEALLCNYKNAELTKLYSRTYFLDTGCDGDIGAKREQIIEWLDRDLQEKEYTASKIHLVDPFNPIPLGRFWRHQCYRFEESAFQRRMEYHMPYYKYDIYTHQLITNSMFGLPSMHMMQYDNLLRCYVAMAQEGESLIVHLLSHSSLCRLALYELVVWYGLREHTIMPDKVDIKISHSSIPKHV